MPPNIITLDVREDILAGREPFARIMETVGRLRDGEQLRVVAPFEPRPLIAALAAQGFVATGTNLTDGGFAALFVSASPENSDTDLLS